MPTLVRAALLLAVLSTPYSVLRAADWTRFRGPNGSGLVEDAAVPLKWSKTENVLWKVEVPGLGHSSPIVVKGRVILQSATSDGTKRMIICYDANTGETKWTKTLTGQKVPVHAKSSLASCTPTSDGERVYTVVWDGQALAVHAFDLDGNDAWTYSLGGYVSQHGAGMSPVAHGGKVYIHYDQDKDKEQGKGKAPIPVPNPAQLVALDAKTGAKAWVAPRKAFRACSASPLIRELPGGKTEVIVSSTAGLTGYDPEDGQVNWDWEWKFSGQALRTVGSPILANGVIVAPSGDGGGSRAMVAVTPGPMPKLLWEKTKETPYVPGPLVKGDHLYWVTDGGVAFCVELKTGKQLWSERAFPNLSKGTYVHSSPLLINGHIVAVAETGRAIVFKATPEKYDLVEENDIGEVVEASLAVADGKLYLRGATHLFCIGKK